MKGKEEMLNRLVANWVYGGFLAGLLILSITPIFAHSWSPAVLGTFLCLPAYMLHQYEEHDNGRFREFVKGSIGHGRDVLSPMAIFIINVPGVWGVIAVSLWLAAAVNPGFGLIAAYLVLVNAVVHIAGAAGGRKYNPGLMTAVLLFLPVGSYCVVAIQQSGFGSVWMHAIGLFVAVAIHVAIVVHVVGAARTTVQPAQALTGPAAAQRDSRSSSLQPGEGRGR